MLSWTEFTNENMNNIKVEKGLCDVIFIAMQKMKSEIIL